MVPLVAVYKIMQMDGPVREVRTIFTNIYKSTINDLFFNIL